jgi:hypothetical protein
MDSKSAERFFAGYGFFFDFPIFTSACREQKDLSEKLLKL